MISDDDEDNNLDFNQTEGTHELMDTAYEKACVYHEPIKIKKVNTGIDTEPKEAII
ncbi:hypothetical protein KI387_037083, partial [Taxus chinensis]